MNEDKKLKQNEYCKKYYHNNKDKIRLSRQKYVENHKEEHKKYQEEYRKTHPNYWKEYRKTEAYKNYYFRYRAGWQKEHKKEIKEQQAIWNANHKEYKDEYAKKWRKEHPDYDKQLYYKHHKKVKVSNKKNYINKTEFNKLFENPKLNKEEIVNKFLILAQNISTKFQFYNDDKDDAISEVVLLLIQKINKFDPNQDCFNFASTLAFNCFKLFYKKNKHEKEKMDNYFNENKSDLPVGDYSKIEE